ncbi:MAG: FG-GAP repeat protein [Planctomycetota bacterium]
MRFFPTLACAFHFILPALISPASAQYCSQLVRPVSGQVTTDGFGRAVELGPTWAQICDIAPPFGSSPDPGRLSLYTRAPVAGSAIGGHLLFDARIEASNGQPGDDFGLSSDRSGGTVVVGAPGHDGAGTDSGTAYLFEQVGGQWTEVMEVTEPAGAGAFDRFGEHVAIEGEWMAIAVPGRNRVSIYRRTNGVWLLHQRVTPAGSSRAGMVAVEFERGTLAICGRRAGAVFEFNATTQVWSQTLPFATASSFGFTGMDLAEERIVIAQDNGIVNVYDRNPQTGGWTGSLIGQLRAGSAVVVGDRILLATTFGANGTINLFSRAGGTGSWVLEGSIPGVLDGPDALATDGESVLVARLIEGFTDGPTLYDLDCGSVGTSVCIPFRPNSTGHAGRIDAVGSDLAADNEVTLEVSVLPRDVFGFIIVSQKPGFFPGIPTGLCIAGQIGRYVGPGEVQITGAAGAFTLSIDLTAMPTPTGFIAAAPGDSWYFQCWHRDDPVVGGSSFTDAVQVDLR